MSINRFLSIDIGTHSTKIVEGKYNKHKVIVEKAVKVDTPRNSVDNGSIANKAMLHSQITDALKAHNIICKDVNCTINSSNIINREIEIPIVEAEEIENLIRFEIQQFLPIRIDDYVLQYSIIEKFTDEFDEGAKEKFKVMVTALPLHMAKAYMEFLTDMGMKPNALDVNFNSIRKLFKYETKINGELYTLNDTVAIIDLGLDKLEIDIISKGILEFTRLIDCGGRDIDKVISERLRMPEIEAERLKIKNEDLTVSSENITMENDEVSYFVKEAVDEWVIEINKILQYYRNKKIGNKIDKIYIHGGSARIKGIESYIGNAIGMQVKKIKSMENIELAKNINSDDLDLLLGAIGAIIRL